MRHRLRGHVFRGHYKAVLVDGEDGNYFGTLIDYVHLNPARARTVAPKDGLESFPWSSLSHYVKPPTKRKPWEQAERGLRVWRREDDRLGRRGYLEHLEKRMREEGAEAGRRQGGRLEFPRFCGLDCDEHNDSHEPQQQNRSALRSGV